MGGPLRRWQAQCFGCGPCLASWFRPPSSLPTRPGYGRGKHWPPWPLCRRPPESLRCIGASCSATWSWRPCPADDSRGRWCSAIGRQARGSALRLGACRIVDTVQTGGSLGAAPLLTPISGNGSVCCSDEAIEDACLAWIGTNFKMVFDDGEDVRGGRVVDALMTSTVPPQSRLIAYCFGGRHDLPPCR